MKKIIASVTTALMVAAGAVMLTAAPAAASDDPVVVTNKNQAPQGTVWTSGEVDPETCMVTDTGVYTLEHPAEYKDVKIIEVEAEDAWTETIEHPEETRVVHHEAVTHEEYHFAKFTRERTRQRGSWSEWSDWTLYAPKQHTSWELSTTPLGTPQMHAQSQNYQRQWQARWDGETRTITTKDAWDEVVVDKEAWTEVIEHPAVEEVSRIVQELVKEAWSETTTYSHTYRDQGCTSTTAFLELGHVELCGQVTITLRNVSPWIYPTSVEIDGVHSYGPTVDNRTNGALNGPVKDQSASRTISFAEDTGTHEVRYRVQAGTERDLYQGKPVGEWVTVVVDSDCEPNPENKIEYGEWTSGTYECGDETVAETRMVTATTYTLVDGEWVENVVSDLETRERPLTAAEIDALDCPVPPVDKEEPPATDEDEPKLTPTIPQKSTPMPTPAGAPSELAVTGGGAAWGLALLATFAVAAGALLARRRRA